MKKFLYGIGAFALCVGFLVGSSNTPVIGAIITGIVALAGTIWSGFKNTPKESEKSHFDFKLIGNILLVFSLLMIVGVFSGEGYRRNWFVFGQSDLPWDGIEEPRNGYEALDWLMVQSKLKKLGYSKEQTKSFYSIVKKRDIYNPYNNENPYHLMLSSKELTVLLSGRNEAIGPQLDTGLKPTDIKDLEDN